MKTFCILFLATVVVAEPPTYRQARFKSEKREVSPDSGDAPYPASGFKPAKEFNLPSRQELTPPATNYGVPADSYGAPFNTYTAPQTEYGAPEANAEKNSSEAENVDDKAKIEDSKDKNAKLETPKKDAEVINAEGAYYVLLPGSQLQRVQYQTENDIRNMAYTARLQYRSEDRAPIFVYTAVPQYQTAAYIQLA